MDFYSDNSEAPRGRAKGRSRGPGCGSVSPKEAGRSGLQEVRLGRAPFLLQNVGCLFLCSTERPPLWLRMEWVMVKIQDGESPPSHGLSANKNPRHLCEAIWSHSEPRTLGYLMFPAMNWMMKQSTLINFIDDTQLRLEGHLGGLD